MTEESDHFFVTVNTPPTNPTQKINNKPLGTQLHVIPLLFCAVLTLVTPLPAQKLGEKNRDG